MNFALSSFRQLELLVRHSRRKNPESIPKSKVTIEIFYDENPEDQYRRADKFQKRNVYIGHYGTDGRTIYSRRNPESFDEIKAALQKTIFRNELSST